MNVHFSGFEPKGLVFLSDEQAKQLANVSVQPGDVLLNITGASIGRVTTAPSEMAGARVNQHVAIIRPIKELDAQFLAKFLASPAIQRMIDDVQVGATREALTKGMIEQFEIPLPPLAEQKRIVAKVDELMALCDRLEAQQQERETRHAALARASLARFADAPTPANLEYLFHSSLIIPPSSLRKSILTLAVQGKLVPFDTDDESQTVGDHIEFQNGYAFKSEWFKPYGMRLCRNLNVSHGILDWRESAFVDDKVSKEFERFALSEGDIVLSLDRPLIATGLKVARVREADLPCLLLQRVAKPVPKHDQLDLSYFMLWLNSSEFVNSIDPGRSNGVPHISTRQVQRLPFVLPPLAEQRRIVAKVEQLMALVDALETQLAAARATAANLLSALVAELTTA
jgi:type I restriction enzyme S subunit